MLGSLLDCLAARHLTPTSNSGAGCSLEIIGDVRSVARHGTYRFTTKNHAAIGRRLRVQPDHAVL
jgi:hypothetical protein